MTTFVHFENKPPKKSLQMYIAKQAARIAMDEEIADRNSENKLYEQQQLRSDWIEQLDGMAMEKKAAKTHATIREEFSLAKKALVKVRQHMLAQLLTSEMETYKSELAKMGKAVHVNRL